MKLFLLLFLIFGTIAMGQNNYSDINKEIYEGNFSKAKKLIEAKLQNEVLSEIEIYDLKFQIEKMDRILKDFTLTEKDVLNYINRYYPEAGKNEIKNWREQGSLEYKIINGEIKYFNRSHANLFRVNNDARKKKNEIDCLEIGEPTAFLLEYIPKVVDAAENKGRNLVEPVNIKLNYTLTINKNAVPAGEVIRCWLPFPREGNARQTEIKIISANVDEYILADNNHLQRTIYMEKESVEGEPTIFNYEVGIKNYNEIVKLDPSQILPYDKVTQLYKEYTEERLPHIVFTEKVKKLSEKIVGDETNPYTKAKIIFEWISENIPWAGAREYSTINSISNYCLTRGYGDCGIKALTFITLCRYNGIPAKWQSGWMLYPTRLNLHDWTEIYFEEIGWVPVDPDFGMTDSDDDRVKYFYYGGIDAYRWIVNDGFSKPLFPVKIFPRSETVDFQRGEVEWRGGNLYFDKWDYHLEVKYE